MTDLLALIEELAQADPSRERDVLYAAHNFAWEQGWLSDAKHNCALELIEAGAYLDAARLLVPEGWTGFVGLDSKADTWI